MDAGLWLAVGGLPVWLLPPILLLCTVTRSRGIRIGFGAALVVALTILYAVLVGWLVGPGLPMWAEAALLWGPVTLLLCGFAWLADRQRSRQAGVAQSRSNATRWLVAAFAIWTLCCGAALFTPAAQFVDLRLASPRPGLVLPLPEDLTLLSAERNCGSEECSESYLIGSPDGAGADEVADRLWTHLVDTKGWQRLRDDAGCRQHGWLLRHQFCGFVRDEPDQSRGVIKFLTTGAVTVTPAARP